MKMNKIASVAALAAMTIATRAQAQPTLDPLLASKSWLNGRPTAQDVKGKVVLVDFYTFECINCKHVEPNLRSLYANEKRSDLVIISVHSPETPYERDVDHLKASFGDQGVRWPVAIDNDFGIWNAYGVSAWPTQLIFDRHGVLRQTIVGEGQDGEVDSTIKTLVAEK